MNLHNKAMHLTVRFAPAGDRPSIRYLMNKFLLTLLLLIPNVALSCSWQGNLESYEKYNIDIGFIGKLVKKGVDKDEMGRIIRTWGKFEPVKAIRGSWNISDKIYFRKELEMPIFVINWLYVIHADKAGYYQIPCYEFYLESFTSIKSESYKSFVIRLNEPN